MLDAPTVLAACCAFDLCHKYIWYLVFGKNHDFIPDDAFTVGTRNLPLVARASSSAGIAPDGLCHSCQHVSSKIRRSPLMQSASDSAARKELSLTVGVLPLRFKKTVPNVTAAHACLRLGKLARGRAYAARFVRVQMVVTRSQCAPAVSERDRVRVCTTRRPRTNTQPSTPLPQNTKRLHGRRMNLPRHYPRTPSASLAAA